MNQHPVPTQVAIPSVRVSVFRRGLADSRRVFPAPRILVAIPSVRVSVFRRERRSIQRFIIQPYCRNPLGSGLGVSSVRYPNGLVAFFLHVAIPSVRVSVFRRDKYEGRRKQNAAEKGSQFPRFGSRCFVLFFQRLYELPELTELSQSPRFGSRCFVENRKKGGSHEQQRESQSPRFGSRCFVVSLRRFVEKLNESI